MIRVCHYLLYLFSVSRVYWCSILSPKISASYYLDWFSSWGYRGRPQISLSAYTESSSTYFKNNRTHIPEANTWGCLSERAESIPKRKISLPEVCFIYKHRVIC